MDLTVRRIRPGGTFTCRITLPPQMVEAENKAMQELRRLIAWKDALTFEVMESILMKAASDYTIALVDKLVVDQLQDK